MANYEPQIGLKLLDRIACVAGMLVSALDNVFAAV